MRKRIFFVVALILVGMVCFAAGTKEGTAQGAKTTLRVELFDRGNFSSDYMANGPSATWIQKTFGDPNNIQMQWVLVPRDKEIEKLNVMMASGDAPDVCFTYDDVVVAGYAKQGGLAALDASIQKYGPDLKAFLGPEVLSYGVWGGKQYAVPANRTSRSILGTWIRKDWLDTLGMPVPANKDQYLQTLRAFKNQDPGKLGDKVQAMGFSTINMIMFWTNLMYSFYDSMAERDRAQWIGSFDKSMRDIGIPGAKEGLRFLNTLNSEGLLSPDWALQTDRKAIDAALANGYVGSFTANAIYLWAYNIIDSIEKNSPQSVWVPCDPFTNKQGQTPKLWTSPIGILTIVPASSKNVDAAIKYLNWMSVYDNGVKLQYGDKGVHYDLDSDGLIIPKQGLPQATAWDSEPAGDRALVYAGPVYKTMQIIYTSMVKPFVNAKYPMSVFMQSFQFMDKDAYTSVRIQNPPDSLTKLAPTILDKASEVIVKSILADPKDFDKVFDAGLAEYNALGAPQVKADLLKAYDQQTKK